MAMTTMSTSLNNLGAFLKPAAGHAWKGAVSPSIKFTNTVYDSEGGQEALYKGLAALTNVFHLVANKATEPSQVQAAAKWMAPIGFMRDCIDASHCFGTIRYFCNSAVGDNVDDVAAGESIWHDLKFLGQRWDDIRFKLLVSVDAVIAASSIAQRAEASIGSTNLFGWVNKPMTGYVRSAAVVVAFLFDVDRAGREIADICGDHDDSKISRILKGPVLRMARRVTVIGLILNGEFGPSKMAGSTLATLTIIQLVDATLTLTSNYFASQSDPRLSDDQKARYQHSLANLAQNQVWRGVQKCSRLGSWFLSAALNSGLRTREKALKLVDKGVCLIEIFNPDFNPLWAQNLHGFTKVVSVWKNVFQVFSDLRTFERDVSSGVYGRMSLGKAMRHGVLTGLGITGAAIDGMVSLKKLNVLTAPALTQPFATEGTLSAVSQTMGWNNWMAVGKDLSGVGLLASFMIQAKQLHDIWFPVHAPQDLTHTRARGYNQMSRNELLALDAMAGDNHAMPLDLIRGQLTGGKAPNSLAHDALLCMTEYPTAGSLVRQLPRADLIQRETLSTAVDANRNKILQTAALAIGLGAKSFLVLAGPRIGKVEFYGPLALTMASIANAASGLFRSCHKDWMEKNGWDGIVGRVGAIAA